MIWQDAALDHARREAPRESCGLLVRVDGAEIYWACRNLATTAEYFLLDPDDYVRAENSGEVLAVVHSHAQATPEPSEYDRKACIESGLPWHIVSIETGQWCSCDPATIKQAEV